MVSVYKSEKSKSVENEDYVTMELRGLSTDEKPTTINEQALGNGSTFIEIDTGKFYMYDLENEEWSEI